ncbi:hypothetical protein GCM10010359_00330 [Streptomyces morookaense]|nr:hypothetical protein GCM10010359_00330 [Streptomyces morookaense]
MRLRGTEAGVTLRRRVSAPVGTSRDEGVAHVINGTGPVQLQPMGELACAACFVVHGRQQDHAETPQTMQFPERRNPRRHLPDEGSSPVTCSHVRLTNTVDALGPQRPPPA